MVQDNEGEPVKKGRLSGPVRVALFFAALAVVLSLVGLGRENNLSLRNIALAVVVGGGSWALISWAVATAVAQVEADVATRDEETSQRREERKEE